MAIRTILHYPDPRLREQAQRIEKVDERIRTLIDDMAETMYAAPGVGLAATQIAGFSASGIAALNTSQLGALSVTDVGALTLIVMGVPTLSFHSFWFYKWQRSYRAKAGLGEAVKASRRCRCSSRARTCACRPVSSGDGGGGCCCCCW
jgi:hypothetical protein